MAPDPRPYVEALLSGLSDVAIRESSIEALRRWRKAYPRNQFSVSSDYGLPVLRVIAATKKIHLDEQGLANLFPTAFTEPYMAPFVEFLNWFERAGFCIWLSSTPNAFPYNVYLTRYGERFLDRADADHPLLPGALERTQARCPGLPDDVTALLMDARRCLDAMLMRPALVLMGVAYELAIEHVVVVLITKTSLSANVAEMNAAKRLVEVKAAIDKVMTGGSPAEKDRRFAVHDAYDFAHTLRRRRNDASHTAPTHGFDDREETEEFLISALRHLPNLWALSI